MKLLQWQRRKGVLLLSNTFMSMKVFNDLSNAGGRQLRSYSDFATYASCSDSTFHGLGFNSLKYEFHQR